MANPHVFGIVLAGGEGKRLAPLTADRAKPAVLFGGNYRLIDFALSNLVNAGYFKIVVLTQYKSHSLDRHVSATWRLSPLLGNYVVSVPAQMREGPRWFAGSADAIFQNLNLLNDERPDYVCVFGADHIYRMDPRQMVEQHIATGAAVTVAGIRVPLAQADQLGVIEPGPDGTSDPRVPREAERCGRAAGRARPGVRVDGQLRLHDRGARGDRHRPTRRTRSRSTTSAATSSPRSSPAARRTSTTSRSTRSRARPGATGATGATSARSTPSTTRTWTSSRSIRSSTSTTSTGRSSPGWRRCRRRSSSSRSRVAPATRSTR